MPRWPNDDSDESIDWEARFRGARTEGERNRALFGALSAGVATLHRSPDVSADAPLVEPLPPDDDDDAEIVDAAERISARAVARLRAMGERQRR